MPLSKERLLKNDHSRLKEVDDDIALLATILVDYGVTEKSDWDEIEELIKGELPNNIIMQLLEARDEKGKTHPSYLMAIASTYSFDANMIKALKDAIGNMTSSRSKTVMQQEADAILKQAQQSK